MRKFNLFHTCFKTNLDLSKVGLDLSNSKHDVEVIIRREQYEVPKVNYFIDEKRSFFYKKGLGLFIFEGGRKIFIYTDLSTTDLSLIETFVNFPVGLCLHQRGETVIHASSVLYKNKVILFAGPSHAGKSTLAAYFAYKHDSKLISEDLTVLEKKELHVLPAPPYLKLTNEAMNQTMETKNKLMKSSKRRGIKINKLPYLARKPDYCFFIDWDNVNKTKKLSNKEALDKIYKYTYLSKDKKSVMKVLQLLAKHRFYELNMIKRFESLKEVERLINRIIKA